MKSREYIETSVSESIRHFEWTTVDLDQLVTFAQVADNWIEYKKMIIADMITKEYAWKPFEDEIERFAKRVFVGHQIV